jgi:hypothetical protein
MSVEPFRRLSGRRFVSITTRMLLSTPRSWRFERILDLNEWGGKDEIALRGRDKIEKRVLPGTFDEAGWVMKLFHR